jgi:hypothetical protein
MMMKWLEPVQPVPSVMRIGIVADPCPSYVALIVRSQPPSGTYVYVQETFVPMGPCVGEIEKNGPWAASAGAGPKADAASADANAATMRRRRTNGIEGSGTIPSDGNGQACVTEPTTADQGVLRRRPGARRAP